MIVAFLDLLGFSWLVENKPHIASDNLFEFNESIYIKYTDNKTHPVNDYEESMRDFVQSTCIDSFKYLISISDSLVIGAEEKDADKFVIQLSKYVAAMAQRSMKPFQKSFTDLDKVYSISWSKVDACGDVIQRNAFPILFRGGISAGKDVCFQLQSHIFDGKMYNGSVNVMGQPYINAYRLECSKGKGPRLFCDDSLVKLVSDKIRSVIVDTENKDVKEIIWTYYACETDSMSSIPYYNANENGYDKLAVPVINMINYYSSIDSKEVKHYKEFLKLIIRGLELYATDKGIDISEIKKKIKEKLLACGLTIDDL